MTTYFMDGRYDGDVYIVMGQSNARGRGDNLQPYNGSLSRMAREDNRWRLLADPTDSDEGPFGSVYPLLADILEAATGIPVAFFTRAEGSTGLVNPADWSVGGGEYNAVVTNYTRVAPCNVTAFLWYQGETDIGNAVAQAAYQAALSAMVDGFQSDLGLSLTKLVSACVGNQPGSPTANVNNIRLAQIDRWDNDADVLAGPPAYDRDLSGGNHWKTDAEMLMLAQRWARVILSHFHASGESARGPQFSSAAKGVDTVTVTFTGGEGNLQNQTATNGWECTDANGVRTVISATGTSNTVTITLDQPLVGVVTVSFCSGNITDTVGSATLSDSGTYPFPPEPIVDEVADGAEDALLKEDGDYLLLESGDHILLED